MSGFLERMATRALDRAISLTPRPLSLFEPAPEDQAPASFTPPAPAAAPSALARAAAAPPRPGPSTAFSAPPSPPAAATPAVAQPGLTTRPVAAVQPTIVPPVMRTSLNRSATSNETRRTIAPPTAGDPVRRREASPAVAVTPAHPPASREVGSTRAPSLNGSAARPPDGFLPAAERDLGTPLTAVGSPVPVPAGPRTPSAGPALPTADTSTARSTGIIAAAARSERTTPAAGTIVTPPVRIEAKPVAPAGDPFKQATVDDPFQHAAVERQAATQPSIIEIHIANIEIRAAPHPPNTAAAPLPVGPSLDAFLERRREQ